MGASTACLEIAGKGKIAGDIGVTGVVDGKDFSGSSAGLELEKVIASGGGGDFTVVKGA